MRKLAESVAFTSGAVTTSAAGWTVPVNTTAVVEVSVVGRQRGGTGRIFWSRRFGINRNGSAPTAVALGAATIIRSGGLSSADAAGAIDSANNYAVVNVTGEAGKDLDWNSEIYGITVSEGDGGP